MNAEEVSATEKKICETLAALESTLEENLACEKRINEQQAQIRELAERCECAKNTQAVVDGLCTLAIVIIFIISLLGCR